MKPLRYYNLTCILAGICLILTPALASLRTAAFAGAGCLFLALLSGGAVLLMLPASEEASARSFRFSLAATAASLGGAAAGLPVRIAVAVLLLVVLGYLLARSAERYRHLWPLFKPMAVWTGMECDARDCFASALFLLGAVWPGPEAPEASRWICTGAGGVFFLSQVLRVLSGRPLLLGRKKEEELKEMVRGSLYRAPSLPMNNSEEMSRMRRLFERVCKLMEEKRPFLDTDFNLSDLAGSTFSNRAYLSRTINILSGQNFSQFVNAYRIRYGVELLRKDPALRITDVAMMSGFRSTVTFNMAFKLNMGETPTQFLQRQRLGGLSGE